MSVLEIVLEILGCAKDSPQPQRRIHFWLLGILLVILVLAWILK